MSNYFGVEVVASEYDLTHTVHVLTQTTILDTAAYSSTILIKDPANFSITLPHLQIDEIGKWITLVHDHTSGVATIIANGSDVIRSAGSSYASTTLGKGQAITLENDGDSWHVVSDAGVRTPATTTTLGGIKVGTGLTITPDGLLSSSGGGVGGNLNNHLGIKTVDYARVDLGAVSGTANIDLTQANYFQATVGGVTAFSFSNPVSSGRATMFELEVINGGSFNVTWPASVVWPAGAPSLKVSGTDILQFLSDDNGVTWRGGLMFGTGSGSVPSNVLTTSSIDVANGVVGLGVNKEITQGREKVMTIAPVGGVLTIDMASGASTFVVALASSVSSVVIQNAPPTGVADGFTLEITANGYGINWGSTFKWPSGVAPTLTTSAGKKDVISFWTRDGGATFLCFIGGLSF